jgi:hypothetical protein
MLMFKKIFKNKKTRNDFILAVVVILIATAGFLLSDAMKKQGDYVVVKVDSKQIHRLPLSQDSEVKIATGESDEDFNLLIIKDGEAFIESADCRDKICVHHKPVSRSGESIVCLPHKVVVEIQADDTQGEVDVVV